MDQPMYHHLSAFGNLDSFSLQEMIDTDIKAAEFDDVSSSGGYMSGSVDSLDLFSDIDLQLEMDSGWSGLDLNCGSRGNTAVNPALFESSLSNNYLEDMVGATSIMVNPNNVMPLHRHRQLGDEGLDVEDDDSDDNVSHLASTQLSIKTQLSNGVSVATTTSNTSSPIVSGSSYIVTQSSNGFGNGGRPGVVKTLKILPPMSSPVQQQHTSSPLTSHGSSATPATTILSNQPMSNKKKLLKSGQPGKENGFPKPAYSYSCLITLALKNSHTGSMSVSEIYKFMCEHFPYFKTAPSGWKNSVRHNLSLSKSFKKIDKPSANGNQRKGCLWALNDARKSKMDEEVAKWSKKDPMGIKKGMLQPETLEALERGELVKDYSGGANMDLDEDDDPRTPTSVSSQGSQGYDSAGSDFVDVEGFAAISDVSTLPELNLQSSNSLFEDFEPSTSSPSFFQANYTIVPKEISSPTLTIPAQKFSKIVLHKNVGQKIFST